MNSVLASAMLNHFSYVRPLRETINPNERLLEAATILRRDKKRCSVVPRSSINRIFCGDEGLQEPECASWC